MAFSFDDACADSSVLRQIIHRCTTNARQAGYSPKLGAVMLGLDVEFDEIQTWADLQKCLHRKLKATPRKYWALFVQQSALGITGGRHEHKS